ncbi:hypothetical protein F4780DRAFT_732895 [Xylariomycetidae sp. FL0641]|nr:hypothetical protein F4780DRAFT_732895 [Xylariomycetidae sp. FL0641]
MASWASIIRAKPSTRADTPEYISDESQLAPIPEIPRDIAHLNQSIETLAELFPEFKIAVFREMLESFSPESRLFVIVNMLLKCPESYVKGRIRTQEEEERAVGSRLAISMHDVFKTNEYKKAVQSLAAREFPNLAKNKRDSILLAANWSYLEARPTLLEMHKKTWKHFFTDVVFRQKPIRSDEAREHPLVIWKSSGNSSHFPSIKATGNAQLDRELFTALILPIQRREQAITEEKDRAFAKSLRDAEAEACEAIQECACCFTDSVAEDFTTCTSGQHMVCFRCVQHSINEAVFGQGWQRMIKKDTGTLVCPALSNPECVGCISSGDIERALRAEKKGPEILAQLDQRQAELGLAASGLPLMRCPYCSYAEVDDCYTSRGMLPPKPNTSTLLVTVLLVGLISLPFLPLPLSLLVLTLFGAQFRLGASLRDTISWNIQAARSRLERRRRGLKFVCQNPACGRSSCISCSRAWVDIHNCNKRSTTSLRLAMESAMSLAVTRMCPRCNTAFVKSRGCNKMACPCGLKMCYRCRADISDVGYRHFCQHLSLNKARCTECNNCMVYEEEDTGEVLQIAKTEAYRQWRMGGNGDLTTDEKLALEAIVGPFDSSDPLTVTVHRFTSKLPRQEEIWDFIVRLYLD